MFQLLTINVISVSLISTAGSPPVPHRIKSGLQVAEKIAVHGLVSRGGADLFQMVCCDLEPVCSVRGQWAPPCIVALLSVLLLDTRRCRSLMWIWSAWNHFVSTAPLKKFGPLRRCQRLNYYIIIAGILQGVLQFHSLEHSLDSLMSEWLPIDRDLASCCWPLKGPNLRFNTGEDLGELGPGGSAICVAFWCR